MTMYNKLTRAREYRLANWLEKNLIFANALPSVRAVAKKASLELSFDVTECNVSNAYRSIEKQRPRSMAMEQNRSGGKTASGRTKDSRTLARALLQLLAMLKNELGIDWAPENISTVLKIAERDTE